MGLPSIRSLGEIQDIEELKYISLHPQMIIQGKMKEISFV